MQSEEGREAPRLGFPAGIVVGFLVALVLSLFVVGWPSFEMGLASGKFIERMDARQSGERTRHDQ